MVNFVLGTSLLSGLLFLGIIGLVALGRRCGRPPSGEEEGTRVGLGAIEAAVYGLLGLLLAFTFAGAAERFGGRRAMIVDEANAIGTAWLRVDLLPDAAQEPMRERFRRYLDARLEAYSSVPDMTKAGAGLARAAAMQEEIWREASRIARQAVPPEAPLLLLPALNEMFDIAATRLAATAAHPPIAIFVLLVALVLVSALLSGHAMAGAKGHHWLHTLAYAAVLSSAVFLILDLEYPRLGLIRIDAADQLLRDVRASMK